MSETVLKYETTLTLTEMFLYVVSKAPTFLFSKKRSTFCISLIAMIKQKMSSIMLEILLILSCLWKLLWGHVAYRTCFASTRIRHEFLEFFIVCVKLCQDCNNNDDVAGTTAYIKSSPVQFGSQSLKLQSRRSWVWAETLYQLLVH